MILKKLFMIVIAACIGGAASAQALYGLARSGGAGGGGTIYRANLDGTGMRAEYSFPIESNQGTFGDYGLMTKAPNNKLYGVMPSGGVVDLGVLFEYDADENTYTKKIDFRNSLGTRPTGALAFGPNGNLYGTTTSGGSFGAGTIFEYDIETNSITKHFDFQATINGEQAFAGLVLANNNKFYGVAAVGGDNNNDPSDPTGGTLFEFDPDTKQFTVMHLFSKTETGRFPFRAPALGPDGKLYGMTLSGGASDKGVIYRFDPQETEAGVIKIFDFDGTNYGAVPQGTLSRDPVTGLMYATTQEGGANNKGVLFEFNYDNGEVTIKHVFTNTEGSAATNFLTLFNGDLYGTTEFGGNNGWGSLFRYNIASTSLTVLKNFSGGGERTPKSGVTLADNQKLYGTTALGGAVDGGTIFEFDPQIDDYQKKIDLNIAVNGNYPANTNLLQLSNGMLYGTTLDGGSKGLGVLFQFDPVTTVYTKVVDFDDPQTKGANPRGNLIFYNGKIYGTTLDGGANNHGTVFSFDADANVINVIGNFDSGTSGAGPNGGLFLANNNKLYLTAQGGGLTNDGAIVEFDPSTGVTAKAYFNDVNLGRLPMGNLVQASNGKLYGLCNGGGTSNHGTIFEYDLASTITKKYDFDGQANGGNPEGSLFLGFDGVLYGMTTIGGQFGNGVIFSFNPNGGAYNVLHSLMYDEGTVPKGTFIQAGTQSNKLYATTAGGGANGFGTIFEYDISTNTVTKKSDFSEANGAYGGSGFLSVAIAPPKILSFSPASAAAGATVTITGENFSAFNNNIVYFGPVKATINSSSSSTLSVVVPKGATSAPISVTVNGRTAYSPQPFNLSYTFNGWIPGSFPTRFDMAGSTQNKQATVADFDNDGLPDAALTDSNGSGVSVFRNTSTGNTLSFAARQNFATDGAPYSIVAADIDGDGKLDLVSTGSSVASVSILRNTSTIGNISFDTKVSLTGPEVAGVAVGDLDNDGKPDIVGAGGAGIVIFKNNSSAGALSVASFIGPFVYGIGANFGVWTVTLADLNGDSRLDMITSVPEPVNPTKGHVTVFENIGSPGVITGTSFAASFSLPSIDGYRSGVTAADLDQDGKIDIIASGGSDTEALRMWRNIYTNGSLGANSFDTPVTFQTTGLWAVSIANVDGDSKPDIVGQALGNGAGLLVLKNACTPGNISASTFTHSAIMTGGGPLNSIFVDMTNDGLPDFIFGDELRNTFTVLKNTNAVAPPVITDVSPASAPIGEDVTITGVNFEATVSENVVYFGAVKAEITNASTTSLTVKVPIGATFAPITVQSNGLTATSPTSFSYHFVAKGTIDASTFATKTDIPTGAGPQIFTIADLNLDGKSEVSVANEGPGTVSVLRNSSTPGTVSLTKADYLTNSGPYGIATGDLDGDGKQDVVVANATTQTLSILRNTSLSGPATLADKIDLNFSDAPSTSQPFSVAIADIDADGKLDIVATSLGGKLVSVFHNNTVPGDVLVAASFVRMDIALQGMASHVTIADLNGDHKPELIVPDFDGGSTTVQILVNRTTPGTPMFGFIATTMATGEGPYSSCVADFNNDGMSDIAVTNNTSGTISLFTNRADEITQMPSVLFTAKADLQALPGVNLIAAADVNGDHRMDIVSVSNGKVNVFKNQAADGEDLSPDSFAQRIDYVVNEEIVNDGLISVGVADIDGDGKPDLLASSASANVVTVLSNNSELVPPIPATSEIGLTSFKAAWNPSDGATEYRIDVSANDFQTMLTGYDDKIVAGTTITVTGLTPGTSYKYRLRSANITGVSNSTTAISVTTLSQPTIASLDPAAGNVGTVITVTGTNFDPVATNNIVKFTDDKAAAIIDITGTTSFTVAVPAGSVTGPISVTVNGITAVSDDDFIIDSTPPTIDFTGTASTIDIGTAFQVKAAIADPETSVTAAKISYRSLSGSSDYTETDIISGTAFTIPASEVGDIGVEYFVKATSAGGETTSPKRVALVKVGDAGLTIPYSAFGSEETSYRIISVPLTMTTNTVAAVFEDDLNASTRKNWRLSHYENGTVTDLTSSSQIVPKLGYWLIVKSNPGKAIDTPPGTMVSINTENPVTMDLKTGWNQIGNPYNFNIKWQDVVDKNPGLTTAIRGYTAAWTAPTTIDKMSGVFVNVTSNMTITIPAEKNPSVNGSGRTYESVPENILDQPNWDLPLHLAAGDRFSHISGIGMNEKASTGYDIYDGFSMPRFFEKYLELNHRKSEHGDLYSMDIVPTSEHHVWEFDIESNVESPLMKLEWDNEHFGDNNKTLVLWDVARNIGVDMRNSSAYEFNLNISRSFKLFYGSKDVVAKEALVDRSILHDIFPNPTMGPVSVAFSIPASGNVRLEIVDLLGRTHWSSEKYFDRGYHREALTTMEGRPGMYIVQMKYGVETGQRRMVVK